MLAEARRVFDQEKRKEMYWRAQEIIHEEQPYMFLFYPATLIAIDKRIRGVEIAPTGITRFFPGFLSWWVPPNGPPDFGS